MRVWFPFRFRRISAKLAFVVITVSTLSATVFVFQAYRTGADMLDRISIARAKTITTLVQSSLDHVMVEQGHREVHDLFNQQISLPRLHGIYLTKRDGTVLVHAGDSLAPARFSLEEFMTSSEDDSNRYLTVSENNIPYQYVLSPIQMKLACTTCHTSSDGLLGYLGIKVTTRDLRQISIEHRLLNISLTIASFVSLAGIILFVLTRVVVRPISSLHAHIEGIETQIDRLQDGNAVSFTSYADTDRTDEIGDLSRIFNRLITRLNDANKRIFELHQHELDQASKFATIGEMAAGLAHEIRNPLAGVLGALQILDADIHQGDDRKELFAEMIRQIHRANNAIRDLLSFARPAPAHFEEIDICEVIDRTRIILQQNIDTKCIKIQCDYDMTARLVQADKNMMQQLIWNIMLNAIHAIQAREDHTGIVSVATRCSDTTLCLEIRDTGIGMPKESIDNIFKPFYTTKHKGTGLGLAIAKRIVQSHNGSLAVTSTVNQGTTFTINFPLLQQESLSL